jgi:hypothetical protein
MSIGTRPSRLMKEIGDKKSRRTVPLKSVHLSSENNVTYWLREKSGQRLENMVVTSGVQHELLQT